MGKEKVKDKCDNFNFEGGLYFIQREKVFMTYNLRGKIKPSLLFIEGISTPIFIDNIKITEHIEYEIDDKTKKFKLDKDNKKIQLKKQLCDIFIDARAIHNMTDKKILDVLSATDDISTKDIVIIILIVVILIISVIQFFI
jgi:hypothetical protein